MGSKSYSKGISWINDCRIPFVDDSDKNSSVPSGKVSYTNESWGQQAGLEKDLQPKREPNITGRFPANILVCDDMLNDGVIGGSSYCPPTKYEYEMSEDKFNSGGRRTKTGIGDKGSNSRYYNIDRWFNNLIE